MQLEFRGQTGRYVATPSTPPKEGGQATVYTASNGARSVAVKVARSAGPWMTREREALEGLRAAGVATQDWLVQLLDHGRTEDGREFLVLDWYPASLGDWLEGGPPIEQVLRALQAAAEAVAKLHAAAGLRDQYLHLDVKPWNFLVNPSTDPMRVVLADLGGVKQGRLLATTMFSGQHSPGYAPLEQELCLARPPDPSIDVHGLAATVYAGLCQRLPDARRIPAALSPAGRRLDQLQRLPGREPAEEEEFERLRRLPVEALVAFDDMSALTSADEARLQNRLVEALLGRCPDAEALGRRIARQLLPVLRAGLAPDPRVREKRVGPLYAALADAAEEVERALRGRETVHVEPAPPAPAQAEPILPAPAQVEPVPPAPVPPALTASNRVVVTEPAALARPAHTATDAIAAFLERANIRGERSLGRTRLVLIAAALLSEVFAHTPAAWRSLAPQVWASSAVLLVGAMLTVLLLRLRPERVRPTLAAWMSVALDAALVTGVSLPGAVWPIAGYPGQAHLPSFAFFLLAIVASAMRLSRPVLRFSVLCNSLGGALLLLIDARSGAAVIPTTAAEFVLWVALFVGASFVGDAVAVRTRRMVYDGAGSALQAERARQALGVYVSEEIAAEAMASDVLAPGGRRQAVAVLYCELNGFSRYAERVSPERLLTELNGFLEVMVHVVRANGGVVDRYLGDAILVVFGVPRPAADSSSRAVSAAAGMVAALRQHNQDRAARGLPALSFGIGVHAGEVVVGNIGTPERMQYTVVGDAVNLASHLQKASAQLGVPVLVSDVVARTVGVLDGATQLVPAGDVVVGGRSGPVSVWTLVDQGDGNP